MLKLLNFNIIIEQASGRYNALSETTQKDLKESLSNGKALLKSPYQLDAYLCHYGDMHRKKLLRTRVRDKRCCFFAVDFGHCEPIVIHHYGCYKVSLKLVENHFGRESGVNKE